MARGLENAAHTAHSSTLAVRPSSAGPNHFHGGGEHNMTEECSPAWCLQDTTYSTDTEHSRVDRKGVKKRAVVTGGEGKSASERHAPNSALFSFAAFVRDWFSRAISGRRRDSHERGSCPTVCQLFVASSRLREAAGGSRNWPNREITCRQPARFKPDTVPASDVTATAHISRAVFFKAEPTCK
ncbi:hypothetical protein Bbelb_153610 [Branchiostoma belcheri]|nr:hypothetical protein Bbelb_153610 [Branchiostoma belcheri]